jgi:hypothetical protein
MASTVERVREHRRKLHAQGLKPVQLWLPDLSDPGLAREAARQSRLVAAGDRAEGIMDWLDSVNAWPGAE